MGEERLPRAMRTTRIQHRLELLMRALVSSKGFEVVVIHPGLMVYLIASRRYRIGDYLRYSEYDSDHSHQLCFE
jgi:hypothetical protein